MPIPRKKACRQCRIAKTRCTLDTVCSRCRDRGLLCDYEGTLLRTSPFSRNPQRERLEPLPELSRSGVPATEQVPDFTVGIPWQETNAASNNPVPALDQFPDTLDWTGLSWMGDDTSFQPPTLELGISKQVYEFSSPRPDRASQSTSLGLSSTRSPINGIEEGQSATQAPDRERQEAGGCVASAGTKTSCDTSGVNTAIIFGRCFERVLSQRKAATPEMLLTSRVLLGQVTGYAKMLSHGDRLPPFIHPQCVLNDQVARDCTAVDGIHRCLREPLANCFSLAHMFYHRNSSNERFVWKEIYAEQTRLNGQFHNFDQETLLAAIQATVIYVLLQAQDFDSIEHNDAESMIASLSNMAAELYIPSDFASDIYTLPGLNRRVWVFYESMRRTMCLVYMIEILLVVIFKNPSIPDCAGIPSTPLPCVRDLWDADATEAWGVRLHRYVSGRRNGKVLTIGDLLPSDAGSGKCDIEKGAGLVKDLEHWCESLDEFGTLVWMAASLDRNGRSSSH